MTTSTFQLYNEYHLGDCVFVCVYFYLIREYIEKNDIHIVFYVDPRYIPHLQEFIPSKNISMEDILHKKGSSTWIASNTYPFNWYNAEKRDSDSLILLDVFLEKFLPQIFVEHLKIPIRMTEFIYEDPDLLERYDHLDPMYHNLDILIINSDGLSGQINIDNSRLYQYIRQLHKKYKIATTKKVEGVPCTLDDQLTIKGIAAISTHSKIIMAHNTGPIVGLMNRYTLDYMKQFYIVDDNCCFNKKKFKNVRGLYDIEMEEIDTLLST